MIEIQNYTKVIRKKHVLDHVNLRLHPGRVYGLKGPNGCGKTMLMRAICGLIFPTEGAVVIDGETIGKEIDFPRSVGLLLENPSFISYYSGLKNLELLASIQNKIGQDQIVKVLTAVGLDPSDKKHYRKYSLGMKQKLGIAGAVMEDPDILILDEPLNALDTVGVEMVHKIVRDFKEKNKTVLLSCHDSAELEAMANEIIVIENGKVLRKETVKGTNGNA